MKIPQGQELIERYKNNYHISADAEITEKMILKHWHLERALTRQMLTCCAQERRQVFQDCYSRLYSELDWLNRLVKSGLRLPPERIYRDWLDIIGPPPKKVYEIGPGRGRLISYLAGLGYQCKAVEITRQRIPENISSCRNPVWAVADAVCLQKSERADCYDAVISDSVIEHLHPDDLVEHFQGVHFILAKTGKYILRTPHQYAGPSDISRIFNCNKPLGMHLKEYDFRQLKRMLLQAGFKHICAVRKTKAKPARASAFYLTYLCLLERLIALLPAQQLRRKAAHLLKAILFTPTIFLVAYKQRCAY